MTVQCGGEPSVLTVLSQVDQVFSTLVDQLTDCANVLHRNRSVPAEHSSDVQRRVVQCSLRIAEHVEHAQRVLAVVQAEAVHTAVSTELGSLPPGSTRRKVHDAIRQVTSQVGVACKTSPSRAQAVVGVARAVAAEMPHLRQSMLDGHTCAWGAHEVMRATATVPLEQRRQIDADLADRYPGARPTRLATTARALADATDPAAAVTRHAQAVKTRRVGTSPAPDGMAYLTAVLTLPEAVACQASLHKYAVGANRAGQPGSHCTLAADELVRRLTGREPNDVADIELQIVIRADDLTGQHPEPSRAESAGSEPDRAEPVRPEPACTVPARNELARTGSEPMTRPSNQQSLGRYPQPHNPFPTQRNAVGRPPETANGTTLGGGAYSCAELDTTHPRSSRAERAAAERVDDQRQRDMTPEWPHTASHNAATQTPAAHQNTTAAAKPATANPATANDSTSSVATQSAAHPNDAASHAGPSGTHADRPLPDHPLLGGLASGTAHITGYGDIPAAMVKAWLLGPPPTPNQDGTENTEPNPYLPPGLQAHQPPPETGLLGQPVTPPRQPETPISSLGTHAPARNVRYRRLLADPYTGIIIDAEQRSRAFTGTLRTMIIARDKYCQTPWCQAPIKHIDHITAHTNGGTTTPDNAQGLCAHCNLTKAAN